MQSIWKYVELPTDQVTMIQETFKELIPKKINFFHVVKLPFNYFLGKKIQKAVLIQVIPVSIGQIHIDYRLPNIDNNIPKLALNIPLENCEQSLTKFWESAEIPLLRYTDNKQPYYQFDRKKCKLTTEFNLTAPVIFRTDIPHSVDNLGPKIRRAISLRFEQDPWDLFNG